MKTLKSTTDFVLEVENNFDNSKYNQNYWYEKIVNHAKTLKLKPELWMFVPTDENGNILEEPQMYERKLGFDEVDYEYDETEVKQYQTALSKVWFKGWQYDGKEDGFVYFKNNNKLLIFDIEKNTIEFIENILTYSIQTIEHLTPYNLEITENFGKNL
jgi:hypothetical protein